MIHVYRCLHCRDLQMVVDPVPGPVGPGPVPCSCGQPLPDVLPVFRLSSMDEWRFGGEVLVTPHLFDMGVTNRAFGGL